MKTNILKRSVSFVLAVMLLLSPLSLPASVSTSLPGFVSASAASTVPGKVTGLKAKSNSTAVALSWNKVPGAAGYNVCRYDTGKKRYVSVINVTGTSVTVKNLASATVYTFKVRAYRKSGNRTVYGAFSSEVLTATRPSQIMGLKAARTADSVTLKWNIQPGAVSYAVYRYDASKKKYYSVTKTKSDTVTVRGLKSGVTYYFAVKPYLTVNNVNYTGPLSSLLKVQTLKTGYKISKYHKIVSGGQYTVDSILTDSSGERTAATVAVKNGKVAMKTNIDGIQARVIRNGTSNSVYLVLDNIKKYTVITDKELTEGIDVETLGQSYAPAVYGNIKTGTKVIGGKKYSYEYFRDIDSAGYICYYYGSSLVRMDLYDGKKLTGRITVKKFTAAVDDSMFVIPKNYGKMNLQWLSPFKFNSTTVSKIVR